MQKEFEEQLKALQAKNEQGEKEKLELKMKQEMERLHREEQEKKRQLEQEEKRIQKQQQEKNNVENRLGLLFPLVNEANLIAKELKRQFRFTVKLVKSLPETKEDGTMDDGNTEIVVKVDNLEEGYYYQWSEEKFNDRIFMMRDLVNEYFDTGNLPNLTHESDPFWDPPEPVMIGQSFVSLKNLGYLIENEMDIKILSAEGTSGVRGQLSVKYLPTDDTGYGEIPEDDLIEEPEELCKTNLILLYFYSGQGSNFQSGDRESSQPSSGLIKECLRQLQGIQ